MKIPSPVVIIVISFMFFSTIGVPEATAGETNKKRWGITTKEPVEDKTENQKASNKKEKTENISKQIKHEPEKTTSDEAKVANQKGESDGNALEKDKKTL